MIRSCLRGLQGTMLMMSAGLYAIVQGLGQTPEVALHSRQKKRSFIA
jgi:hypothetical protein